MDINKIKQKTMLIITKAIIDNKHIRYISINQFLKLLYKVIVKNRSSLYSKEAKLVVYNGLKGMFLGFMRNLDRKYISKEVANKVIKTLLKEAMLKDGNEKVNKKFEEKYGRKPPGFFVLSPTKKCNLKCVGCYASSDAENSEKLEWNLVDKIMTEAHDVMGIRFFVISGGEPMLYNSQGKNILDLPRKWKDSYFLMFTNGTLITEKIAKEMAELGNVTPAISVEGFEKETDERRGKGVHKQVLKAMENLRNAGVPFGTSVTATNKNIDILLEDKMYDYYFDELGATYMWMFHYMPIGRKYTTDLMITAEQRFKLFKKWLVVTKEKEIFIGDFWNSALLSNGCMAYGKNGGYFYIDWNGKIMPCVFIPYYKDNIKDIYKEGKTLCDALTSDLFLKGREWQENYHHKDTGKLGNMLRPCSIRDHHKKFLKIIRETNALPEDKAAKEALEDEGYHKELIKFDKELAVIMDKYWKENYEKKEE